MVRDPRLRRPSGGETLSLLGGMALGAVFMFFADPEVGRRRRACVRDALARVPNRFRAARLASPGEGVAVEHSVLVQAPVEAVFRYGTPQHFPTWMSHVREVATGPAGELHWVLEGPAGMPVRWEAREVRREENRLVAWRSTDGAMVDAAGQVTFEPEDGGTRVRLLLRYVPFGGLVGQAVARAMGDDPVRPLDEDLVRFKAMVEAGMPAGAASWRSSSDTWKAPM